MVPSFGLLPGLFVLFASLGVVDVAQWESIDPKVAQVTGACGAILAAIALLFLLLTKKCSERESWDQPRRKVKVIFVSSFLVLATCVASYALGAAVQQHAGPHAAWSVVCSAVVLTLSAQ